MADDLLPLLGHNIGAGDNNDSGSDSDSCVWRLLFELSDLYHS